MRVCVSVYLCLCVSLSLSPCRTPFSLFATSSLTRSGWCVLPPSLLLSQARREMHARKDLLKKLDAEEMDDAAGRIQEAVRGRRTR